MIKKILKFVLAPFLGRRHFQAMFSLLHQFSLKGMNYGGGADFRASGEEWVLKYVKAERAARSGILFDVGANQGGYSLAASDILQGWKIYAFEPAPKTFAHLQAALSRKAGISVYNIGFSSAPGQASLNFKDDINGLASLYNRQVLKNSQAASVLVKLDTIDDFCKNNNIEKINFLKLDVEGHELEVLKGAKTMVGARKIDFLQFEFGGTDVDARVFLRDFFDLLSPNYKISRILKNGLENVNYDEVKEIFTTTNYLVELK